MEVVVVDIADFVAGFVVGDSFGNYHKGWKWESHKALEVLAVALNYRA